MVIPRAIRFSTAPAASAPAEGLARRAVGADARRALVGSAAIAVMLLAAVVMVLTAAGGRDGKVVNSSQAGFPGWMAGVFGGFDVSPSKGTGQRPRKSAVEQ